MRLLISSIWVVLVCFQTFQVNAQDFITQWQTTGAISQLRFKALTTGTVNYTWSTIPSGLSGSGSFIRLTPGDVTISGLNIPANSSGNIVTLSMTPDNLRRFYIDNGPDRIILINVTQWGAVPWSSMERAFLGCSQFNIVATDVPDLSNVASMRTMFGDASSFNQDIGAWNISNVTDMQWMFSGASSFNQPIGNWNTANVTNMIGLFRGASSFNQPLDSWNTANVTNMADMFSGASSFNQPLDSWNTANVTNMSGMFNEPSSFNQPIGNWNTSNVTNMAYMFSSFLSGGSFNQPIGDWSTSSVTDMRHMFAFNSTFNQPIGDWNTSNVTNMTQMFRQSNINQNLGSWIFHSNVNLNSMLNFCGMSCDNYTATLVGWQANNPTVAGRSLGASNKLYGTSAVAARNTLINNQGWTITGDFPSAMPCSALLPIELVSFIATLKYNDVNLHWQTSSEINNHYFDIEYSFDGSDFATIGRKEGAGNSSTKLDYHFVHQNVKSGMHYYRLKQVDYDGQYSYSDLKSLLVKGEGNDVSIYPNPTSSIINVDGADGLHYALYNLVGRQVKSGQIANDVISIDHLPTGMYYLHLDRDTRKSVYKIWKE